MNKPVLALGLIAFTVAALFVPYRVAFTSTTASVVSGAYGTRSTPDVERVWRPAWDQPATGFVDDGELFTLSGTVSDVEIDTGALVIQLALVLVLTLGLAYLAPSGTAD